MSPRPKFKNLSPDQINRSLALHTAIKTFRHYFPEEFAKTNIVACKPCNGLGITDQHYISSSSICMECMGVGFIGYEHLIAGYVCKHCNGVGCKSCSDNGFVDWIRNAMKLVVVK
jgi:hypothetical protein